MSNYALRQHQCLHRYKKKKQKKKTYPIVGVFTVHAEMGGANVRQLSSCKTEKIDHNEYGPLEE